MTPIVNVQFLRFLFLFEVYAVLVGLVFEFFPLRFFLLEHPAPLPMTSVEV
jgi:hypothetical protein